MSAVVTLPPHGTHVHINNRYRDPNDSCCCFRVPPLAFGLTLGVASYLMAIKQVSTQNFVRNVQTNISDRVMVNVNGTDTLIILESGHYNIDVLVSALNDALFPLNATLQLAYDYDLKKLTLNVPNGVTFRWQSYSTNDRFDYQNNPIDRTLAMLGFDRQKNITYVGPTTVTASWEVNLIPTQNLHVCFQQNMGVVNSDGDNRQIIASIPCTGEFGSIIAYEPIQPMTFQLNPLVLETLDISVFDDYGNRVEIPDSIGLHINFTLITNSHTYE